MSDLRLGAVEDFPFMEPPDGRLIRDGYRLLEELGALDGKRKPTPLGRQLARFPLDPTLARMVVGGADKKALREVLVIVAALAVQDPRERPRDKQQQADQAHQPFEDKDSDFLWFLNLWHWAEEQREALSRNQFEKALKKTFLAPSRMREWRDTHRQLLLLARDQGWTLNQEPAEYESIHRALLTGLLGNVMQRGEEGDGNFKPITVRARATSCRARRTTRARSHSTSRCCCCASLRKTLLRPTAQPDSSSTPADAIAASSAAQSRRAPGAGERSPTSSGGGVGRHSTPSPRACFSAVVGGGT